jgi:hypothetical protein
MREHRDHAPTHENFLLFKPPRLWHFVMAAQADWDNWLPWGIWQGQGLAVFFFFNCGTEG